MGSVVDLGREIVLNDYSSAEKRNKELFMKGDVKACCEYIYPNQKEDANTICDKFHDSNIRAVSIVKRTKVGMDGLMIEIAKIMTTHPDDTFVIPRENVFFITAMSNVAWEKDMIDKLPACFKDSIYHHGKLQNLKDKLKNIKNALIINDEIDTGDKKDQKLHKTLRDSGILDMKYMEENNIRFVFVSATMVNELRDLFKWGNKHTTHYMSIPDNYIGHKDFLDLDILQEFYEINETTAEKWVKEDILENYKSDYRVHIIRVDRKIEKYISDACKKFKITFKNHTSEERISHEELVDIFNNICNHTVISVKGFYRRANYIPNEWKKKIGATHEKFVKNCDANVQVQGLPGRISGYWKKDILEGHKTGPHRTSVKAIIEYENFYKDPFGELDKKLGSSKKLFLNPAYISNSGVKDSEDSVVDKDSYRVYSSEKEARDACKKLSYLFRKMKENDQGFIETSLNRKKEVVSLEDAIAKVPTAYGTNKGIVTYRTYYPCYVDTNDSSTLRYVVIIRPSDIDKVRDDPYFNTVQDTNSV